MVARKAVSLDAPGPCFSAEDARRVADRALAKQGFEQVNIDLGDVERTTTAALARLILLRGNLLRSGRDLRISHLRGRARALYQISRLGDVLPQGA